MRIVIERFLQAVLPTGRLGIPLFSLKHGPDVTVSTITMSSCETVTTPLPAATKRLPRKALAKTLITTLE